MTAADRIAPSQARLLVDSLLHAERAPGVHQTLRIDNWLVEPGRTPVETRVGCLLAGALGDRTERSMRRLAGLDAEGVAVLAGVAAMLSADATVH